MPPGSKAWFQSIRECDGFHTSNALPVASCIHVELDVKTERVATLELVELDVKRSTRQKKTYLASGRRVLFKLHLWTEGKVRFLRRAKLVSGTDLLWWAARKLDT